MRKASVFVIGLFLLIYILPLGVRPIIIPDEVRYGEISREMLVSGDWVVPHLNGLRYFEKPVLGYWLNALSMMLFGENAFAIRFPSALAAGISGLMIFCIVRRFAGGYSAGILSAIIFLTCMEVFAVGCFCVLDTMLSLFLTAAMISFFFAYIEDRGRKRTVFLAFFGAFCGLAFLIKGFTAFAVPVVIIVPFMIWQGRWKELFVFSWVPIIMALLIILPWAVMIHLRESDFWRYFIYEEHIRRFLSKAPQHPEPFWFFIPIIIGGALPWTVLLPATVQGIKWARLKDPFIRFALCWFFFPFLFFSASHGKLGTYILPCFPPLAILITIGLLNYLKREKTRTFTISSSLFGSVIGIFTVLLIVNQVTGFSGFRIYGQTEIWKFLFGVAGLLTWSLFLLLAGKAQGLQKKLVLYSCAPLLLMFSAHFIIPDQSKEAKAPGEFLLRHSDKVQTDTILVTDDLVRAVCWFYKRDDVYMFRELGEHAYGLRFDNLIRRRFLTIDQFLKLAKKYSGKRRVTLITDTEHYAKYRHLLQKPVFEDVDCGFVFVQF